MLKEMPLVKKTKNVLCSCCISTGYESCMSEKQVGGGQDHMLHGEQKATNNAVNAFF